jgi:hypothetical protein
MPLTVYDEKSPYIQETIFDAGTGTGNKFVIGPVTQTTRVDYLYAASLDAIDHNMIVFFTHASGNTMFGIVAIPAGSLGTPQALLDVFVLLGFPPGQGLVFGVGDALVMACLIGCGAGDVYISAQGGIL